MDASAVQKNPAEMPMKTDPKMRNHVLVVYELV
jgi:hypothetical protein